MLPLCFHAAFLSRPAAPTAGLSLGTHLKILLGHSKFAQAQHVLGRMTHAWHSARPEAQATTRAYLLKLHLQLAQLAREGGQHDVAHAVLQAASHVDPAAYRHLALHYAEKAEPQRIRPLLQHAPGASAPRAASSARTGTADAEKAVLALAGDVEALRTALTSKLAAFQFPQSKAQEAAAARAAKASAAAAAPAASAPAPAAAATAASTRVNPFKPAGAQSALPASRRVNPRPPLGRSHSS